MISKLLNAGADQTNRSAGSDPLMLAPAVAIWPPLSCLLDHKAQVDAKEKLRGTTPLDVGGGAVPSTRL